MNQSLKLDLEREFRKRECGAAGYIEEISVAAARIDADIVPEKEVRTLFIEDGKAR